MRYLSICSGIEAASVAWGPLGFTAAAFAEVEPFPSTVLAHHYPSVPNYGDITKFRDWPDADVDVLVGGTPCQSFSVAGLRAGLADPRGNLALTYLAIADRYRPRWVVWENVPGVLSSDSGRDFGAFLGGLGRLGYGFAYRVLDAQYFGLAQRRKRVFVVGHLGDWRRAAAVLFERESLSGHPAPRREAGEGTASGVTGCLATGGGGRAYPGTSAQDAGEGFLIPSTGDISHCLNADGMGRIDYESETLIAHSLRADGFNASKDGTGRGTQIVPEPYTPAIRGRGDSHDLEYRQDGIANAVLTPNGGRGGIGVGAIAFSAKDHGADAGDIAPTLRAGTHDKSHANGGCMPAVAFDARQSDVLQYGEKTGPLDTDGHPIAVQSALTVRRLTPRECCRLMGFPDSYLDITYRGKPAADGNKYKALGNSMAVPVMRWIGERIKMVNDLCS